MSLYRPKLRLIVPLVFFLIGFLYVVSINRYQIQNAISYSTRPLWDKDSGPSNVVPHYYAEGMKFDSHMCKLHGWKQRSTEKVRVLDAILMSSELDLLEVRMEELDPVVDWFFIVESNATFTGLTKPLYFADNRARFAKFERKIVYRRLDMHPLAPGQDAWYNENLSRNTMTVALKAAIAEYKPDVETLVLMSDVDEIPSAHSIRLARTCDFGRSLHLQLRDFIYSFEWFSGYTSWRASIHLWAPNSYYRHSKSTENILADAGWHCSYCFRTIPEYAAKMKGFSHSDRIGGRINLLDPKRIQDTICNGKDIFGMLPEAYSYTDLITRIQLRPQKTAVSLPRYLLENAEKYRFLLPGGCKRETTS